MNEKNIEIEKLLQNEGQQLIAKAVSSLPDEPLSLVWRSNLNEVLRQQSAASKRRKWMLNFLSPALGLGVACALAGIVLLRPTHPIETSVALTPSVTAKATQTSMEASLVQLHQDDLRSADVAGTGLNPTEAANDATVPTTTGSDGSEDDFEF